MIQNRNRTKQSFPTRGYETVTEKGTTMEKNKNVTGFDLAAALHLPKSDCTTFGALDPTNPRCADCPFAIGCAARKTQIDALRKAVRKASEPIHLDPFGIRVGTVQSYAAHQFAADQNAGIVRPMRKAAGKMLPYVAAPWNPSCGTVYDYRKVLVRNKDSQGRPYPLATEKPFMILWSQFTEDARLRVLTNVEAWTKQGKLLPTE